MVEKFCKRRHYLLKKYPEHSLRCVSPRSKRFSFQNRFQHSYFCFPCLCFLSILSLTRTAQTWKQMKRSSYFSPCTNSLKYLHSCMRDFTAGHAKKTHRYGRNVRFFSCASLLCVWMKRVKRVYRCRKIMLWSVIYWHTLLYVVICVGRKWINVTSFECSQNIQIRCYLRAKQSIIENSSLYRADGVLQR